MIGIVEAQQASTWFMFKFFPLGLIAFFIFADGDGCGNESRAVRFAGS